MTTSKIEFQLRIIDTFCFFYRLTNALSSRFPVIISEGVTSSLGAAICEIYSPLMGLGMHAFFAIIEVSDSVAFNLNRALHSNFLNLQTDPDPVPTLRTMPISFKARILFPATVISTPQIEAIGWIRVP